MNRILSSVLSIFKWGTKCNNKQKNSDNAQKNEKIMAKYIKCQKNVALILKRCYSKATKTIK